MKFVSKEKIKSLLFPISFRNSYEGKWWHRLALVLIGGTTVLIFILGIVIWTDSYGSPISFYKELQGFSFETNYKELRGKDYSCYYIPKTGYYGGEVYCGANEIYDKEDLFKKYTAQNIAPQYEIVRSEIITKVREGKIKTDNEIWSSILSNNSEGAQIRAKFKNIPMYFFHDVYLIPLATLGWFIFWASIIYRAILYVIFGNKKNS